ncbi:phage holin family protein [Fodinibius sediminis]|uniref:Putative membrane protein n=1 Tax=Fodinibius sediminis TaxID=1214077 RepID=A0A521C5W5_9BACT|nr:phage holin family protein [Fodinibius sediminis]SMO54819.1 putative membrane protein [Fodinibius sediminis]
MITKILVNSLAVLAIGYLLKGIRVKNYWTALGAAILLALVNAFVKPIVVFLTLPITIITLGLFLVVINALMLMLVEALLDGLEIKNFWWAVVFGILLSFVNVIFL